MNILLTGGTGFIGGNLYVGLKDDYKIFAPRHSELEITDRAAVRKFIIKNKIKVVIHTAVKGGDSVFENILKMYLSIYGCLDLLDKFINFGSGAEYGKTQDLEKISEKKLGKFIPTDDYGLGKLICSQLSRNNKKITTLIPFGIFGQGEDYRKKFIANSIVKNLLNLPIKIKQNVVFDYLYIKDLIPMVRFFLKNEQVFGDFNVSTTESISLFQIVKLINKNSKKPSTIKIINKKLNFQYTGSNKKILRTIPHLKITPYEDSIKEYFNYFKKNIKSVDRDAIIQDNYLSVAKIR